MPNSYKLRGGTLYHSPYTVPVWSRSPLRRNGAPRTYGSPLERRRIIVQGSVQGSSFRSFVSVLARRWNLSGHVLNDSTGAIVEIQGIELSIENFLDGLLTDAPPLVHINAINTELLTVSAEESGFTEMKPQAESEQHVSVPPNRAIC